MRIQQQVWHNQLVFVLLCFLSVVYAWQLRSLILCVSALYFFVYLSYKKQRILLVICVFCSFLFVVRMSSSATLHFPPIEQNVTLDVHVRPDSIQVNGDHLSFTGRLSSGQQAKFSYRLRNEEEKEHLSRRAHWSKTVQVTGAFQKIVKQRNIHGFHQQAYYESQRLIGRFQIEQLALKGAGHKNWRAKALDWVEQTFNAKLATYIKALLLGEKSADFNEVISIYRNNGVLHFFTISGMHVYLFYHSFFHLLRYLRLTQAEMIAPLLLIITLSLVFCGGGVSIWRAASLYILKFFKNWLHWSVTTLDLFSIVLILFVIVQPNVLLTLSGQLSFFMSALLLFSEVSTSWYGKMLQSQAFTIIAAPLMMYYFYEWPLLGGILTWVLSYFFSLYLLPLLLLVVFVPHHLLQTLAEHSIHLLEGGLSHTAHLTMITGQPALWLVIVAICIGIVLYQMKCFALMAFVCLAVPFTVQKLMVVPAVSFLDVGQGDSVLIQTRFNREVYLIDTGGDMWFPVADWQADVRQSSAEHTIIPTLKGQGISVIDGLFLTHGDTDHIGHTLRLSEEFHIKHIYVGLGSLSHRNMEKLVHQLPKKTTIHEVPAGTKVGRLHVLAPKESGAGENEDSLVIQTQMNGTTFLFTGDLDQAGELQLLHDYPTLRTDVLHAGHHGSRTSTNEQFVASIQPQHAVISAGYRNRFNHPHEEVLTTLANEQVRIWRTDEQGMIRYSWPFSQRYPDIQTYK